MLPLSSFSICGADEHEVGHLRKYFWLSQPCWCGSNFRELTFACWDLFKERRWATTSRIVLWRKRAFSSWQCSLHWHSPGCQCRDAFIQSKTATKFPTFRDQSWAGPWFNVSWRFRGKGFLLLGYVGLYSTRPLWDPGNEKLVPKNFQTCDAHILYFSSDTHLRIATSKMLLDCLKISP